MTDKDFVARLHSMARTPPAMTVNPARAVRTGRRARRARSAGLGALGLAAVVASGAGVYAAVQDRPAPAMTADRGTTTPSTAAAPAATPSSTSTGAGAAPTDSPSRSTAEPQVICGGAPLPTWVPEDIQDPPRVYCGGEVALDDLGGEPTGTADTSDDVPGREMLPVGVDEVDYIYPGADEARLAGDFWPFIGLTIYEDNGQLVNEALPGAQEVELDNGTTSRVTTTDNGLGPTRIEWITSGHSYLLLGNRVNTPDGVLGPTLDELLRMAASTP